MAGDVGKNIMPGFVAPRPNRRICCRYRNFLMACTALYDQQVQPDYFPVLDSPIPPGVRNLQRWLECAWAAGSHRVKVIVICIYLMAMFFARISGFDEDGAKQLKNKILNTRKWIGTAGWSVHAYSGLLLEHIAVRDDPLGCSLTEGSIPQIYTSPSFLVAYLLALSTFLKSGRGQK